MIVKLWLSFLICLIFVFSQFSYADDGDPIEMGPMDVHEVSKVGQNQKVLVIYAQSNDYRILASDLAAMNASENQKVAELDDWYQETSWNKTTFDVTQQRDTGGNWYVLPEGILDYVSASGILSMEFRDAAQASAANPTPPASVTATAVVPGGSDPSSDFDATEAGDYWYAVSGFRSGVESALTRISGALTVSENEIVKLTVTRPAANDVDRYIVYRTGKGQTDNLGNYRRIGYADVTGATDEYIDPGIALAQLANHQKLLTDAMAVADADIPDFEAYNGVIVILYSSFLRGQSAGAQTFNVNGTSFKIQTINQSSSTGFGRFTHEMGHWLTLPDQYDPITASPRGYWTTMDGANDREYAGWEKDFKLGWITNPSNVKFLERPGPGNPDLDQTFKIVPSEIEETAADTYTAIKIKSSDSVHYYVEGRDAVTGNVSDITANNFVVVTEAVDAWPPGIYPKRTLNEQQVLPAGAPVHIPEPSIDITYTGINAGPPESYDVNIKVKAEEQPDPAITPWDAPPWETMDIWVDSQREGGGWDDLATALPKPSNGEAAWVNHTNRIYARITNNGAADANNIKVRFRVNTPGGVGDAGQFVDLATVVPASVDIPAGGSRNVYAEWTPTVGAHTCIEVEIEHIPGEKDIYNNFAQENVNHFYTGTGSPWKKVTFPVRMANPFKESKRVDLEIKGLQPGWKARFSNKWVNLESQSLKNVDVTITPPADAPRCTRLDLDLYGMTQIDDYIQVYGGLNPIIHLADPIKFLRLNVRRVDQEPELKIRDTISGNYCQLKGVTAPAIKQAEIAIIVTDSFGKEKVYFTTTDDNGAFESTFPANQPGTWSVYTYYAGDDCNAPTESTPVSFDVPLVNAAYWPWLCCVIAIVLLLLILIIVIAILRNQWRMKA